MMDDAQATYCPDCQAQFMEDEEGYEWDVCIECGGTDVYEIRA